MSSAKREPSLAVRIYELRSKLGKNQTEFAELLGVAQTRVSDWESGKTTPSAASYLRLGDLLSYPESAWFYAKAGVNMEAMIAVAEHLLKERGAPLSADEFIRIPLEGGEAPIALRSELVPNPLSTRCVRVDRDSSVFAAGDIVVLDDSATAGPDDPLQPFWKQVVLIEFPQQGDVDRDWPRGLSFGRLDYRKGPNPLYWVAELGTLGAGRSDFPVRVGGWQHNLPSSVKRDGFGQPDVRDQFPLPPEIEQKIEERRELRGSLVVDPEIERALNDRDHKVIQKQKEILAQLQVEARERASTSIRLRKGLLIHGRMIGWFRPGGAVGEQQGIEQK